MDEGLAKIRHDRSKKDFPSLKLEEDEFVEYAFFRAKTYLKMMFGGLMVAVVVVLLVFLLIFIAQGDMLGEMGRNFLYIILAALVAVGVFAAYWIWKMYDGNRLFVTNKHVIQMVMTSPLASSVNMIDLASIEDASFAQNGILPKMFRYGTFRLSTIGDETTYTFDYANVSGTEMKAVSKLIVDAKKKNREEA